ncbi:MAG TPA: choice-of-anchor D domain-containing protein, partial [Terriglobales bacterium]|nr:choice-of-anchor D domain-containing protein [Terriglobales bacterium]
MKNYRHRPNSQQKPNSPRGWSSPLLLALVALLLGGLTAFPAAGQTPGKLVFSPASVSFGSVLMGTTNSQTIQLMNTGTLSVTISSATVSGKGFLLQGITTPLVLAGGKTTNITLNYTPTLAGYVAGTVSIVSYAASTTLSNGGNTPLTLTLTVSGTGVTATRAITATPTSLSFGNDIVGSSKTLAVTLKNTGNSSVTFSGVTISGAGITTSGGGSGTTLAPGQTATMDVTFAPKTAGSVSGTVKVASNATNSPATIVVTGDGLAGSTLTATPTSASFGSVPMGTTNSQTIQLKNTGTVSVTISSATVSGTGFQVHGITTPLVLAGGATASATLSYTPTTTGYVAGSVSILSNATNKTLTMTVSGTGATATRTITATPASLSFGNENVGSSNTLAVALKNTGNSSVTLSGITISGAGFTASGGGSGTTLAPGQNATVDVTFVPKTSGSISGTVKVAG